MRNSGGDPTQMWMSDALACTALRRMSFKVLLIRVARASRARVPIRCVVPTRAGCPCYSLRVLGHPQDLVHGGQALQDLVEPVLPQGDQALFAAQLSELVDVGVA